jgi:hypothetical protein
MAESARKAEIPFFAIEKRLLTNAIREASMGEQKQWHFCQQCSAMFFGGDARDAGICQNPFPENNRRHVARERHGGTTYYFCG